MFPTNVVAATTDEQLISRYDMTVGNSMSVTFGYVRFSYGSIDPDTPLWGLYRIDALFGSNDLSFRLDTISIPNVDNTFNHIRIEGDFGSGTEVKIFLRRDATYDANVAGDTSWNWSTLSPPFVDGNVYIITFSRTDPIPEIGLSTIIATDPGALFVNGMVQFTIDHGATPVPDADFIVSANGAGDFTTWNDAINSGLVPGDIVEVRSNTPGAIQVFTENVLFANINGTDGNEIIFRIRDGDSVYIHGTNLGTKTRLEFGTNASYLKFDLTGLGADIWSIQRPPGDNSGQYESQYGLRVQNGAHHLEINIGDDSSNRANKMLGANNFSANMVGRFGSPDGCHHIKVKLYAELHGDNNSGIDGDFDWGDLFRMSVPNWVIEGNFHQGGHNTLSVEEYPGVLRNAICDNDWRALSTGEPGYRAAEISGDKSNLALRDDGSFLVENSIFRNAFDGGSPNAQAGAKWQARRGVFRYCSIVTTRALGIKNDRNAGIDGSVTESKFYHITLWDTESVLRTSNTTTTFNDLHIKHQYKNFLIMNLGPGDPQSLNSYIYMTDKSSNLAGFPDSWKGDKWEGITVDTSGITFNIRFEGTGASQIYSLADALTTFPNVFINWDEEEVTFSNPVAAQTSFDFATAFAGMTPTNNPPSLTDVVPLTVMVGAGTAEVSGTFEEGSYFTLADTDWDLGYFGEENDFVSINGTVVQLLTLNKNTGFATWDIPVTWSNDDPVFHAPNGVIPINRGAVQ